MQIAIVGAGMAGLSCATRLAALGHEIALFDKGRGPGGRMATRRVEADGTMLRFDHGAQYFTARDPRFVEQVARWEREGVLFRGAQVELSGCVDVGHHSLLLVLEGARGD